MLPGGQKLERAKLRGEVSDGMILSERELELGQDHAGILVLEDGEPGTPLTEVLPVVETVLDVEPTGNRPDLFSVYGIAREVAALFDLELAPAPGREPERVGDEPVDIRIDDFDGCPRYVGRLFRDVSIGPSPAWLRARLTAAGMRPISNVVDVTNYVMLGLGNPLHAFDHDTLADGRIVVRRAREDEKLRTLDGVDRRFGPEDLMIADAERVVAIAGIMGGEETEVTERTTNVLLEAANFEPVRLHRTSERLKLRTEGLNRWEKGIDPHLAGRAATWATELIVTLSAARWVGDADAKGDLPARPVIELRPERADAIVGISTPPDEQGRILERIGFGVADWPRVEVPTWRARDVTREIDVIEEVARMRLEDVPFTLPLRRVMFGRLTREQRLLRRVEDVLVGLGLSEAYTPTLVPADDDPNALRLPSPMTAEQAVVRTTLLRGLLEAARRNLDAGASRIALFEIAYVFLPSGEKLPDERTHVAGLTEGGFDRARAIVAALHRALGGTAVFEPGSEGFLHPRRAARVAGGWVGELHPTVLEGTWGAFELDLDALIAAAREPVQYEDVISYPGVKQDLAFVVPETVTAGELVEAAHEAAGDEVREVRPFDVYRGDQVGEGRKSLALHVVFQSPERTLSDEDAAALRERIVAALAERFGAVLRTA